MSAKPKNLTDVRDEVVWAACRIIRKSGEFGPKRCKKCPSVEIVEPYGLGVRFCFKLAEETALTALKASVKAREKRGVKANDR